MSRRLREPMPDSLVADQRTAADPAISAWVEANAGSGKTHVLTDRVVRLLLTGVRPESILCLTYTKAAAAEMRRRVSQRLAGWAVMDEPGLVAALTVLERQAPGPDQLRRARALFAHALDTPGGLKIVTIHAFCESILHRFPLEAGVPFDFAVVDEVEAERLVLAAREAAIAAGVNGDPLLTGPVETLFDLLSDVSISDAVDEALAEGRKLRPLLKDVAGAKRRLRRLVGDDGRRSAELRQALVTERLVGPAEVAAILAVCPPAGTTTFESKLARIDAHHPQPEVWRDAFLTQNCTVPKNFPKQAFQKADPALADLALREARRLEALSEALKRATLVERSEALLDVLADTWRRFVAAKRARSLLDFDDLIERVSHLFGNQAVGPWVRYKLDAGITHILVDEGQDTNPEQWQAVRAIADEFFEPNSAVRGLRTLFAVGDQKQSIYSFQGARPEIFLETGRLYERLAARVEATFRNLPLRTSFRTLPRVLEAVDLVFARPDLQAGVLASDPVHHDTARAEGGGTVTLWPVEQELDTEGAGEWPIEAGQTSKSAARRTAERIADAIAGWIASRRPLSARNRPVSYDDILILVQSRNAVFGELIRALHLKGIPTPGADRLTVTTHIAVLDLLALGDVLTNPADDLQLAALLRSPLFDVSEEELFALAQPREKYQTLWQAMQASSIASVVAARKALGEWRRQLDYDRPFGFFTHVLYAGGGLKRFHARMGGEVDDVFAEFLRMALDHEQSARPSLLGFLATVRAQDVSIRRELGEGGTGVRVMTVHGAKGLEAPVVILADAASKPVSRGGVFIRDLNDGPILVHASGEKQDIARSSEFREERKSRELAEYWRKLYVGMTRAEDELYLAGMLTRIGKIEGSWYEAVEQALAGGSQVVETGDGSSMLVYPADRPKLHAVGGALVVPELVPLPPLPPVPANRPRELVSPSAAFTGAPPERAFDSAAEAIVDAETARKQGIAVHALLQHLPKVPFAERGAVALRALESLMPESPAGHAELAAKALRILGRLDFSHLFGHESRAEVPFLAEARRHGTPVRLGGRIDRLVVEPDRVLVVDFKSDAIPPRSPAEIGGAYRTQLGLYALVAKELYPNRRVEAAILWTASESLMFLPAQDLLEAVQGFTMA